MPPYETNKPISVILFDVNGDPVDLGGGVGENVTVTNFPSSYPLPDAQVIALTPPPAITGFSTELKQDDMIAELQSIEGKDFATQTTLADILAKIIASPSTEAKQDSIITALSSLGSEATLADIFAKLIAAPATEAKQDDGNALLTSIESKDFATEVTLAAILAKIIASPATESKQDSIIDLLDKSNSTSVSSVSSSITSVTILTSNANRKGATFFNDSTSTLYLKFGSTASMTSFSVVLVARAFFEIPYKYTGIVDGIWNSASGAVRVTEFT